MSDALDDTRHRLLEAAGEVFAQRGFAAATIREICARAGANLAAVSYHFGDKEGLYVETVRHAHHSGREHPRPEWPGDAAPEQKLRGYVHQFLSRLFDPTRPAWHARLMSREVTEPTKACEALVEGYIRKNFEMLEEILGELLPPGTSDVQRHLVGFSVVGQCLHFKIAEPIARQLVGCGEFDGYDVEQLTDHITRFSLAALGRAASLSECPSTAAAPCRQPSGVEDL